MEEDWIDAHCSDVGGGVQGPKGGDMGIREQEGPQTPGGKWSLSVGPHCPVRQEAGQVHLELAFE